MTDQFVHITNKRLVDARLRYLEAMYPDTIRGAVCYHRDPEKGILGITRRDDVENVNFPGGKVDPGETYTQAAERELFEETGCVCAPIDDEHLIYARLEGDAVCVTYKVSLRTKPDKFNVIDEGTPGWYSKKDLLHMKSSFRTYNKQVLAWMMDDALLEPRVGLGNSYEYWLRLGEGLTKAQIAFIADGEGPAQVAEQLVRLFENEHSPDEHVSLTRGVEIMSAVHEVETVRILMQPWLYSTAYSATV